MTEVKENFIIKNWTIIVGILTVAFVSGGIFSEFRLLHKEVEELKRDTDTKINQIISERERKGDWLEEQEQRIDDLEEWKSYEYEKNSK